MGLTTSRRWSPHKPFAVYLSATYERDSSPEIGTRKLNRKEFNPVEMASLGFNLGFSFSNVQIQHRKVSASGRARVFSCSSSSSQASPQGISTTATPPEIELEFFGVMGISIWVLITIRFKTQKVIKTQKGFFSFFVGFVYCSRSRGTTGRIRWIKLKLWVARSFWEALCRITKSNCTLLTWVCSNFRFCYIEVLIRCLNWVLY